MKAENIPDKELKAILEFICSESSSHVGSGGDPSACTVRGIVDSGSGDYAQSMGLIVAPGVNISYANGQFSGGGEVRTK